jgi:poly(3-hydroxyalkanoate) synthetase
MAATGYLEASAMATAFNMLRPEDLIWFSSSIII